MLGKICRLQNGFLETVKRNLSNGIALKLYRPEINVEIMAKLRIETVDLAFNIEYFPPASYNLLQVQLESIDHFIRGHSDASRPRNIRKNTFSNLIFMKKTNYYF